MSHSSKGDVLGYVYPNSNRTIVYALLHKIWTIYLPNDVPLQVGLCSTNVRRPGRRIRQRNLSAPETVVKQVQQVRDCGIQEVSDPTFCQIIDLSGRACVGAALVARNSHSQTLWQSVAEATVMLFIAQGNPWSHPSISTRP